jgi:hypothetical protein
VSIIELELAAISLIGSSKSARLPTQADGCGSTGMSQRRWLDYLPLVIK